jgi:PAS domain S-box-containing protein
MRLRPDQERAHSASLHLVYFALIVALPLLLLVGALLWRSVALERAQLERRILQVQDSLVAALERDFDRQFTTLQTLATLPSLAAEDWPAFHAQASSGLQGKGYLVLVDTAGRQLVNTYVPYGQAPATTGDPETLQRIARSGQPVVSDLFISLVMKQPVYNVSIPVMREGQLRFVMSIGLLPSDLRAILESLSLEPYWTSTIWDGKGMILARSRDQGRLVGTAVPTELQSLAPGEIARAKNVDGEDAFTAVGRSAWSDWRVAIAFPASLIDRQVRTSLAIWGATILMVGGLVVSLAWLFGRDLTGPLQAATAAARALGRGERFRIRPSRITEINAVNVALLRAQREVEESSAALRRSEEQLRTAAEAAEFGAHQYDVASDRTLRSPQFLHILGTGEGEQTATFEAGLAFVHPEDREATQRRKQEILAGDEARYQLEYRIRRRDGEVRWVMDRGQVVRDPASGRAQQVVGVLLDITDLKVAEQRQRLLFEELNHRVKNTLAIVQSLAHQTLRSKSDPAEFAVAFEARLGTLARAHNLLTRDSWQGASLGGIVTAALAPFMGDDHSIRIDGPAVTIPPGTTVTLSLMLHELATNAAKYGALSTAQGSLAIGWTATDKGSAAEIHLQWLEAGGPAVSPPESKGFGARLLAASARQLGGQIDIDYAPAGVRCDLRFVVPAARDISQRGRQAQS